MLFRSKAGGQVGIARGGNPAGPSDGIRTHGFLVPNEARYQLRYTRIAGSSHRAMQRDTLSIIAFDGKKSRGLGPERGQKALLNAKHPRDSSCLSRPILL